METEDCGGKPMEECKENCTLSAWMEVGRCSAVCGFGNQKYKRFVISEAKNGGTPCSSFALEETRTCFEEPCIPENCTLTGWAVDGPCSTTCGDGIQKYARAIISNSKHGGIDCTDFALSETRPCNIKKCPRDCEWGKWSAESVCSATCGKGTKKLSRTIAQEAKHGGKMCIGEHTKTQECNLGKCPGI